MKSEANPLIVSMLTRLLEDAKEGKIHSIAVAKAGPEMELGYFAEAIYYEPPKRIAQYLDSSPQSREKTENIARRHRHLAAIRTQLGSLAIEIDVLNVRIGHGGNSAIREL